MNRRFRLLPALLVVLLPIAVQAATENGVRAWVKTAPVTQRNLQETLTVYGEVRPDPEQVTGISAAHGGEVTRLWVGLGQVVEPGQQLLELTTDPAARRAYEQARAQVAYARKNLEQVKGLFGQQLATRAELAKAQQELANARSSLQAEVRLGANRAHQIIRAPQAAIVTRVNVAPGDRVQAGASLLTLGARAHLWVTLGIEPEDARRVQSGMNVDLTPVFDDAVHIKARIAQVHAVINPKTRLVDAVVKLQGAQTDQLVPGMRMRGRVVLNSQSALTVPASAVLRDSGGSYVFVIAHGVARRVAVNPGIAASGDVAVQGDLQAGQPVVVLGNYELHDGMAVREHSPDQNPREPRR